MEVNNQRSLTDKILTILNQKVRSPTNAFFVFFVKMASPKHKWWAHTSAKQFAFISEEYCSINKDRCSLIANNTFHRSLSNIHYQCIHLYIKRPKSWLSFRFRFKNPEVYLKESIKLSVCTFRWVFFCSETLIYTFCILKIWKINVLQHVRTCMYGWKFCYYQ